MQEFSGKIAVVTGGGTGMGRELVRQLVAEGCDVAFCDVSQERMQETIHLCEAESAQGVRVTAFPCDVSDEAQMQAFANHVRDTFETAHINLLFNNAGIAGGGSFLTEARDVWERTFNVCWGGVYNGARAFMPMLTASTEGHIVNTSSVNGFYASAGPNAAHTAYSAAKFAVKGFTEALVTDLRLNAPHVHASVVMPGHIGTSIVLNGTATDGDNGRRSIARMLGVDVDQLSDTDVAGLVDAAGTAFRDNAPTTAAEAAAIILQGVKDARWRILVGEDANALDRRVRADPERAYDPDFNPGITAPDVSGQPSSTAEE